jgi:tetratricopeptide (TPR) repeat protein
LIQGSLALNNKDNDKAEDWFLQAQALKLPSDNERGMIILQLANINAMKGKWGQASHAFREIKKLKITEGQLKEQINQFEQALKQRGQIKQAGRQGQRMSMPSGKRRRPKMR